MRPWYRIINPREDLRKGLPLNASDGTVHLKHVRTVQLWSFRRAVSPVLPADCDERRWVDGVLARKKGLGF